MIKVETCREKKSLGPGVEIEGGQVGGGRLFDRRFLVRRELGLQLIGDGFGNLALDGKHIGQITIVGLCPQMRVGPRIDQLRVHPHLVGRPLHTAFEQMRDAELLPDLAQIALRRRSCTASPTCG